MNSENYIKYKLVFILPSWIKYGLILVWFLNNTKENQNLLECCSSWCVLIMLHCLFGCTEIFIANLAVAIRLMSAIIDWYESSTTFPVMKLYKNAPNMINILIYNMIQTSISCRKSNVEHHTQNSFDNKCIVMKLCYLLCRWFSMQSFIALSSFSTVLYHYFGKWCFQSVTSTKLCCLYTPLLGNVVLLAKEQKIGWNLVSQGNCHSEQNSYHSL